MDVPEEVKQLRSAILEGRGERKDDIEFTFSRGQWNHLGEATFYNRCKSHPDVTEKWFPDILNKVREEQARLGQQAEELGGGSKGNNKPVQSLQPQARTVQAH